MKQIIFVLVALLCISIGFSVGNVHIADVSYPEQVRPGQEYTITFHLLYNVSSDERGEGAVFIYPEDPPAAGIQKAYEGLKPFDLSSKPTTLTIKKKAPNAAKTQHFSLNISYYIGGTAQDPDHTYNQRKSTMNITLTENAPETVVYKKLQIYPPPQPAAPAQPQQPVQNNPPPAQNNPQPPPVQNTPPAQGGSPQPVSPVVVPANSSVSEGTTQGPSAVDGLVKVLSSPGDNILYFFGFGCCLSLVMLGMIGGYIVLQKI